MVSLFSKWAEIILQGFHQPKRTTQRGEKTPGFCLTVLSVNTACNIQNRFRIKSLLNHCSKVYLEMDFKKKCKKCHWTQLCYKPDTEFGNKKSFCSKMLTWCHGALWTFTLIALKCNQKVPKVLKVPFGSKKVSEHMAGSPNDAFPASSASKCREGGSDWQAALLLGE